MNTELEEDIDDIIEWIENRYTMSTDEEEKFRQHVRNLWKKHRPHQVTLDAIEEIVTTVIYRRFGPASSDKVAPCPNSAENP